MKAHANMKAYEQLSSTFLLHKRNIYLILAEFQKMWVTWVPCYECTYNEQFGQKVDSSASC